MMDQKKTLQVLVLCALILPGCVEQKEEQNQGIQVFYSTGSSWTGWQKNITVDNSGLVYVVDQRPTDDRPQSRSYQMDDSKKNEFMEAIRKADVYSLKDVYSCMQDCPADRPTRTVKFIIDGKEKTIFIDPPTEIPENLNRILEKISLIDSENIVT
jgi:hypothetical protein